MLGRALVGTIGIAVLLLDPIGAFSKGEFHYSEADMRQAVEGTWRVTVDGKDTTFTLTQATAAQRTSSTGLIRSASACRTRSFVKAAAACGDMSKMPLDAHVVKGELPLERGKLMVWGDTFDKGHLELEFRDGYIDARISKHGNVTEVEGVSAGKNLTVELVRQ